MKKIEIEIPESKRAEWINGVLTLVDDTPKDVTDRIKTFDDACAELGDKHPLVDQYKIISAAYNGEEQTDDLMAYLKLRIITAALNQGWAPDWTNDDEYKYYALFCPYTEDEYNELDSDDKDKCYRVIGRSNNFSNAKGSIVYARVYYTSSNSYAYYGSRIAFKTRELALYAGRQFIELWADFIF